MKTVRYLCILILFNLLVIAVILASIEWGVRHFIPEIVPLGSDSTLFVSERFGESRGLNPGAVGLSYGKEMRVDSNGFWYYNRDTAFEPTKRILLLGDSVTMGIGVNQSQTFGALLQQTLGDSIKILNPSVIGYSIVDYRNVINYFLSGENHPDEIHIFWCLNDVYADLAIESAPDGQLALGQNFIRFLHQHVYSYQWLKNLFANRPAVYYNHDIAKYDENSPWLARSMYILININEQLSDNEIPIKLWISPYLEQLIQNDNESLEYFEWALTTIGIEYENTFNTFIEQENVTELFLYGDGIHFSEKGHKLMYQIMKNHF